MRDDVLIVGAGPTGLALALWLTEQGVKVRIIDKSAGPSDTSRAMAVQARTLEFYRQLGFADEVIAAGHPNPTINIWIERQKRAQVSLGGAGMDKTPYPYILVYPQDRHERLLIAQLEKRGVSVERSTELLRFDDNGDKVEAVLKSASGREVIAEAPYLVGCDGARSVVRQALGTGFPGGTYSQFFYVADVELTGPVADGEVHIALDRADFLALLSYGQPGQARLIGIMRDDQDGNPDDLTFSDVNHRVLEGLQIAVEKVNWFSTYRVHHRVTDSYRSNRVFLAGDAAHIHSPAGGQGMNTGIGDAVNLAWKLAAVIKGKAPDSLLDSYQIERRAFAEQLVATTDRIFTFVTSPGNFANFVRTKIAPIVAPAAYRIEAVREFMFRLISQIALNYRDSPISAGQCGDVHGGDRLPWVETETGDNHSTLNVIGWQVHVYGETTDALAGWCRANQIPLHSFTWNDRYTDSGLSQNAAYLVRPDTYVAYVSPAADPIEIADFLSARGLDATTA